jgi:hypothetical protein
MVRAMKNSEHAKKHVRILLKEALIGLEGYLRDYMKSPMDFTSEAELKSFSVKVHEMLESMDTDVAVPILGMWRIMETWPYKNDLRQKIWVMQRA